MSTTLVWKPVSPVMNRHLDTEFKWAFCREFFGHDGSLEGTITIHEGGHAESFLKGLAASGSSPISNDARVLLEALHQHKIIELRLEQ
jgi:hypothetical protein